MKPFNLAEAKAGKPICCRDEDDKDVLLEFLRDDMGGNAPLLFRFRYPDEAAWRTALYSLRDAERSIIMKPTKRTLWVNLYPDGSASWHHHQKNADMYCDDRRINNKAYPIEIEE